MPEVNGQKFPYTEEGMKAAKEAEMEVLETPGDDRLMKLAEEADMALQINLSEMESDRDIASLVGQLESLLKKPCHCWMETLHLTKSMELSMD